MKTKINSRTIFPDYQLHLLILVPLIFIIIFAYVPMSGIIIAFKDFIPGKGVLGSPWVGLKHFRYMMQMPDTFLVVKNTIIIATLKIIIGFPVPIIFALLLNEIQNAYFKKSVQTIVYLPYFLSWVLLGGMVIDLFSVNGGIVNQIIGSFGIQPIYWLGDNRYFRSVLITTDIWKNFGFSAIVYLATLTNIDKTLYEAARIDGANRWKQTLYVTIPGIMPIVTLLAILNLGNILNAGFDQIFTLYNPLVYKSSDVLDTFVYRLAFEHINYSLGTAIGLFKSVVSLIFIVTGNLLAYKYTDYRIF
jgi:putative aldouronate transport system permease protein